MRGRPLPGASAMDPVVSNRFRKATTPRLLYFLFGNSLINRPTPCFFDFQTFLSISCLLLLKLNFWRNFVVSKHLLRH